MGVLREGIGAAHHEQRAVEHVIGVKTPGGRRVEDVALEHLDAHRRHQHDDQPGGRLAAPGADAVSQQENTLGGTDLAVAATNLAQSQTDTQATLAAIAKMSQNNLFDYVK